MKKRRILSLLLALVMVLSLGGFTALAEEPECPESEDGTHKWGEVTVTQAPTCVDAGTGTHTCTVCNTTENVEIPALGHDEDYTAKGVCTRCGAENPDFTPDTGDDPATPAPKPAPMIEYEQDEVKGTGYVLVLTGPIDTVTVKGWNADASAFFTLDQEGVITGNAKPSRDKKDQVIQLQIPLDDAESVYTAAITVRGTGSGNAQPLGVSLYQFDENQNILSMVFLRDPLAVRPEDGEVRLDIDTAKEGQDALIVHTPDKSAGGEPLPTSALSGEDIGAPYIVTARVEVGEQAPETEQNSGTFRRHGEVAYFRAPEQEGYKFDGWYLEGQNEPLTTEVELFYFVKEDTVLIARYTDENPAVAEEASHPGEGMSTGLLIGLIAGGTLALAGIVIAILAIARKNRGGVDKKYPLVREREEILVQAAPLTDMQAAVDPNAMSRNRKAPKAPAKAASNRAAGIQAHQGPMAGKTISIKAGQIATVGRGEDCNVVFPSSYLSRIHCEIRFDQNTGMYMVKDLSANGTYFADKRRLPKGRELAVEPGTKLLLASNECTVTLK